MTVIETRPDAPREDLIRMTTTLRHQEDGNLLVGYAAVFNEDTEIDSWEGRFVERIAPGAFRKTLRERGDQVKVLFNHGMDPSIGDKPLGKPTVMKEDDRGLYVEVPLDDTSYNADIKALLRSGALDGMSFRMTVVNDDWDTPERKNALPERTIKEIRLYEFGPVTFPAYKATEAGVRAHGATAFEAWRSATHTPSTTASLEEEREDPPADEPVTGEPETPETPSGPVPQPPAAPDTDDDIEPLAVDPEEQPRSISLPRMRTAIEITRDRMQLVLRDCERYLDQ